MTLVLSAKDGELAVRASLARVPLCGCGSTDRMWEIVRDILQRSQDITDAWDKERAAGVTSFGRVTGFYDPMGALPADAVEFAAQVLDVAGLLEHGSSVQCAWLTAPGRLVLLFLRKYGVDGDKWPEWATTSTSGQKHGLDAAEWRSFSMGGREDVSEAWVP